MNEDTVSLSLFPTLEGWSCHLPCNTTQNHSGFWTYEDHCIWHILILEFCTRTLHGPIFNNSCIEAHLDSCLLLKLLQYVFWRWSIYWLVFLYCCHFEHPKCLSIQLICQIWEIPWLLLCQDCWQWTLFLFLLFTLFYFFFFIFIYFLFLEQLGLGFISHAVTSWWPSHKTDHGI